MPVRKAARLTIGLFAAIVALGMAADAVAQEKKIKIGVIFDLTGPLAGGGSELQYIGAKIMLDHYSNSNDKKNKNKKNKTKTQNKPNNTNNKTNHQLEQE